MAFVAGSYAGQSSVGVQSTTVNAPAGLQQNDLVIAFVQAYFSSGTITPPSASWQLRGSVEWTGNDNELWIYTLRASGSEPASYTWTISNQNDLVVALVAYRDVNDLDVPPGLVANVATAPVSVASPSVTPSNYSDILVTGFMGTDVTDDAWAVPSGMTSRLTGSVTASGAAAGDFLIADQALSTTSATGQRSSASSHSGSLYWAAAAVLLSPATAPAAPTLVSPGNAGSLDVSSGVTFSAIYNSTDNSNQSAYALRIKVAGAGSYSYWNAATGALQSTIVWNAISTVPAGTFSVTLPNTAVANGNNYNWSLASQNGLYAKQGAFATDYTFTAEVGPTVTVNGPSGTVTSPTPTVTWTTVCASGSVQTYYRVIVYTAAQYSAAGFAPGMGASAWDSTKTAGATSSTVTGVLPNSTTCRAYVQATETGNVDSTWSYVQFTVAYDTPATPTLTATTGTQASPAGGTYPAGVVDYPVTQLTVAGHDNLLSEDDASFEATVGTWGAGPNWTITRDTSHALDGSGALKCVRANTTAGGGYAHNGTVTVTPGKQYTALVSIYADTTTAGLQYDLLVHDQSGGAIASTTVTLGAAGTWSSASVQFTPAAGVTAAQLLVTDDPQTTPASGQSIWVDQAGIFPGTVTTWTRGGLAGLGKAYITYDYNGAQVPVRTANGVTLPAPDQTVTVVDAEVIPGTARSYTAYVQVDL